MKYNLIKMKRYFILLALTLLCSMIYAQKQTTAYFEFIYDCTLVNTSNNTKRNSWSYEYENDKKGVQIAIDVKINPNGEDYPKELLAGMVTNTGYIKTSIGTFKKLYAAVSTGETQGYYLRKATFNTKHKMYIVSVVGTNKELTSAVYKQLEQTFITK
ncbi:hypothetical protein FACS1894179_09020 [Bacteroidia bacterium]|nr:hypothetical protein FACS1894169_12360 [Bacteroidia bacterium]GHV41245.1 hypothetical protein FACS1894179_09020 [Bacteroidia bacterium]